MAKYIGQRPAKASMPEPVPVPLAGLLVACPAVWEYLSLDKWEDGKPRQTATISIFIEHGLVKVSLNDRACSRGCFHSGHTMEEALSSLEKALQTGTAEWRQWKRAK